MIVCETQPAVEMRERQFIENRFFLRTNPSEVGTISLPLKSVGHVQQFLENRLCWNACLSSSYEYWPTSNVLYSTGPLIRINWDSEPYGYAENPDN